MRPPPVRPSVRLSRLGGLRHFSFRLFLRLRRHRTAEGGVGGPGDPEDALLPQLLPPRHQLHLELHCKAPGAASSTHRSLQLFHVLCGCSLCPCCPHSLPCCRSAFDLLLFSVPLRFYSRTGVVFLRVFAVSWCLTRDTLDPGPLTLRGACTRCPTRV